MSIGRVQTPVLGLVVHRDIEIQNFISKPFYEVLCDLIASQGEKYQTKWQPSSEYESHMDEDNRVLSKDVAQQIVDKVQDRAGKILNTRQSKKATPPPLPYSLSTLQIDAAKRFGMSAQTVLDTCQNLYERHKLITYPRSDCRYLPKEHLNEVNQITNAIKKTCTQLSKAVEGTGLNLKSKAWNDSKVSAHHAIIPTAQSVDLNRLSSAESNVYQLIARQYLIQFYLPFEFIDKQIDTEISGELFVAKQKEVVSQGWKVLFPTKPNSKDKSEFSNVNFPVVKVGDEVRSQQVDIKEKNTTPPKHFTDASLLSAMTGIARYVADPSIKKVLRDTDGLGTEATRAGIIELLFKRAFLIRKGKDILASKVGTQFICSLPKRMITPDMTAHWEFQLESISQKEIRYLDFMVPITNNLGAMIDEVKGVSFTGLKGMGQITFKPKSKFKVKRKRKNQSKID